MSELFIPLALIGGIGLLLVLTQLFRKLDRANAILAQEVNPSSASLSGRAFLQIAKWYVYLPATVIGFGMVVGYQMQRNAAATAMIEQKGIAVAKFDTTHLWQAPELASMLGEKNYAEIQYGYDLISHTADYLGPQGTVATVSNGMNCQNCHLAAGSKPWGNNYSAVAATYPKFRARSGAQETIAKRVNDCFQRSLNGKGIDSTGKEMMAIIAYIEWLGGYVPKGRAPKGAGLTKLKYLTRAAKPDSGRVVFVNKCQSCHGTDGQGLEMPLSSGRRYPPLWGANSYNEAAGLFRLSSFAGYVKSNMPFGASFDSPQLTDAEAWDVAAFVNSQPRPKHLFLATDWPKIEGKPIDHPFGPYRDSFSEVRHKYGPFGGMVK